VPAKNAALVPDNVAFTEAAVLPMAIDTAVCGLFQANRPLGLPWPTLDPTTTSKVIIVYGASSSVGSMAVQLATAAGVRVTATASPRNHRVHHRCGATSVFDYKSDTLVSDVVAAFAGDTFSGMFDDISTPETFAYDLAIMQKLSGGNKACTHQPPKDFPGNVKAKFLFGSGEIVFPLWENFVAPALDGGQLRCLTEPLVVGRGMRVFSCAGYVESGCERKEGGC